MFCSGAHDPFKGCLPHVKLVTIALNIVANIYESVGHVLARSHHACFTVSAVGSCSGVVGAVGVVAGAAGGVATCNTAAGIRSSQQDGAFD